MTATSANIDISIIIVNYKSWHHLKDCLSTLNGMDTDVFSYEVIVVDNCSNDGEISPFREKFPTVQFVENSGNNGFANGCNFGASQAKGSHLFFLNPDTIANKESLHELLTFAKADHTIGIVSCHQKNNNGSYEKTTRLFPSLFTLFGMLRALYKAIYKSKIDTQYDPDAAVIYPDWVSGSVVFMSRNWFDQIQGWNEDYWMYFEDVDICRRVKKSNGKIALLQNVEIIHNHGGASRINFTTTSLTKTEVIISKHVYVRNHFKGVKRFLILLLLTISTLVSKLLMTLMGLLLFFIPKMKLQLYIAARILGYYVSSTRYNTWLSPRSMNYKK